MIYLAAIGLILGPVLILLSIHSLRQREAQPKPENFDGFDYEYACLMSMAMRGK